MYVQSSAAMSVQRNLNNHFSSAWHNTADPTVQKKTQWSTYKSNEHIFGDSNVHILDGKDRCFKRGVKEAIFKQRWPQLSPIEHSNSALALFQKQFYFHSHLGSCDQRVGTTHRMVRSDLYISESVSL